MLYDAAPSGESHRYYDLGDTSALGRDGRGALPAGVSATPRREADNDDKRRSVSPRVGRGIFPIH